MRIGYGIITRERPLALINCVTSAVRLRSGQHEIRVAMSIDDDDEDCLEAGRWLQNPRGELAGEAGIMSVVASAPLGVGDKWNRLLPALAGCDLITLMTDRLIPVTQGWDEGLARHSVAAPNQPFIWNSVVDQGAAAQVIPGSWVGKWAGYTNHFPFWFIDTWFNDVWALAVGRPQSQAEVYFAGTRRHTMGLRDLHFWIEHYWSLRHEREAEALELGALLGLQPLNEAPKERVRANQARYHEFLLEKCAEFESIFGDPSPPTERYLEAKALARSYQVGKAA